MACSTAFSQAKRSVESATGTKRGARNCRRQVLSRRQRREERAKSARSIATSPFSTSLRMALFISLSLLLASSAVADDKLQFNKTKLADAREGYFTLSWNAYPSAVEYQLTTADGHSVYRGVFPKAFVSGLADGTYEYHVDALDAGGQVLATTTSPAVVEVEHWSLRLALTLLTCGCVVFLVVVGLIVKGTLQARVQPPPSLAPSALEPSALKHRGDPT